MRTEYVFMTFNFLQNYKLSYSTVHIPDYDPNKPLFCFEILGPVCVCDVVKSFDSKTIVLISIPNVLSFKRCYSRKERGHYCTNYIYSTVYDSFHQKCIKLDTFTVQMLKI
jgi:hypothetical protein